MLTDLKPEQIEEIGRAWCSRENDNIPLERDDVLSWDSDGNLHKFRFDITSLPQRKEIEELDRKRKEREKQHGKSKDCPDVQALIESARLYGRSPDKPENREIVGMVKSGKLDEHGNTYQKILGDCFLLTRARADKKYMILTDKDMYDHFHRRCKAIMGEIELVYLNPDEHRHLLDGQD